jgi:acyl-CoA reductase-like NAD-dependent aldehyde dehydrogenase
MQTEPVTEEQVALEEFKRVDKDYRDATAAVRRYAFEHAGRTFTTEYALLERKLGELALERNAKLVRWSSLKQSSAPVRTASEVKRTCTNCGSDLVIAISSGTRCNQCGFQA